ncbi:HD domain-containing phosphohydrolase [Thermus islandicus]|uniref:HD domain-containing phosphohydrolase n=1 Tax=Thermus islandicus TaxID=540988 RepID=UPI0003B4FA33|nr:HD domain-containing phosphohydrolase [Thermus islandicus]
MGAGALERKRLEALARAFRLLAPLERREEVYCKTVGVLKESTRAASALLLLYRPEEDVLELVAAAGLSAERVGFRLSRGQGVSWRVLEEGRMVFLPDVLAEPSAVFLESRPRPGAYLGVPLRDPKGQVLGVLSLDTVGEAGEILPEEAFLAQALAEAAGMALARIAALEEARLEAERHKALLELSLSLEASREPLGMAREALETLLRLTPYHGGALYRFRKGEVRPEVMVGRYPRGLPRLYQAHPVRFGQGLQGSPFRADLGHPGLWEGPVYVEDYARFPGALRPFVELGLRSALLVPLRLRGRPYGVLALATFGERVPYRKGDEDLLKVVAKRLEEALERLFQLRALRLTREAALKALSRVLECRDLETKGHTERVAELAVRLAKALGFPDLEGLRLGAYFHDLGKLALPDEVLKKPSALVTREWRLVQTHPEVGLEILKDLPFFPKTALNVVLHHHERWDGSGYPKGLKGEEIPLEARIFAVADVWDALVSERPYKPAWPPERAREELRAQAGKGLDPRLVEVFLRLV